jgi:hypothetical protein
MILSLISVPSSFCPNWTERIVPLHFSYDRHSVLIGQGTVEFSAPALNWIGPFELPSAAITNPTLTVFVNLSYQVPRVTLPEFLLPSMNSADEVWSLWSTCKTILESSPNKVPAVPCSTRFSGALDNKGGENCRTLNPSDLKAAKAKTPASSALSVTILCAPFLIFFAIPYCMRLCDPLQPFRQLV